MTSLFKKVLKGLAVVPMLLSTSFAAVSVWDGSVDDSWYDASLQTYNLTSAAQLAGLAKLVNGGNNFSGKTVTLGVDIMLNDTTSSDSGSWVKNSTKLKWTSIGNTNKPFSGEFDGLAGTKNRKIIGLFMDDSTTGNYGFFGNTANVIIKNIDLIDGFVHGANSTGALAGRATGTSSINNITIKGFRVQGAKRTGGLIGYSTGTIQRVSVEANVVGTDSVGGVAGFSSAAISGTEKFNISFAGDVTGRDFVGGVVGRSTSSLLNAHSEGSVIATGTCVGGIVGRISGTITSVYHVGGKVAGTDRVGGVAGWSEIDVKDSYAKDVYVSGKGWVGGVIGDESSSLTNVYSENTIVVGTGDMVGGVAGYAGRKMTNVYHKGGDVSGANQVGGLFGREDVDNVLNSYSEANVTGTGSYVGGLIGFVSGNYNVKHSYALGNVRGLDNVGGLVGESFTVDSSFHKGVVTGRNQVGGVVGYARGAVDSVNHVNGSVSGATNVGGVIGHGGALSRSFSEAYVDGVDSVGGVMGRATGIVKKVYAVQNVHGTRTVGGLVGKLNSSLDSSYFEADSVIHEYDQSVNHYVAGGLVGKASGEIKNSWAETNIRTEANTGGIVGSTSAAVSNCRFRGSIKARNWRVGGIAGITSSTITNSHSEASISGGSDVGGVAGRAAGALRNVSAIGNVTGTDSVGGIVGHLASTMDLAVSSGVVNGRNMVGGLAGYASGIIDSSSSEVLVNGSANRVGGAVGYITADLTNITSSGVVSGVDTVGGIAGFSSRAISNSSATHSVNGRNTVGGLSGYAGGAISSSFFVGDSVIGRNRVGGLLGYSIGTVNTSYSTAAIRGTDDVGGLIGGTTSAITNSYATGNVTGADFEGENSDGFDNIGGLVGYATAGSIATSFALGDVFGTKNIGGLAGRFEGTTIKQTYANGSVTGSYYGDEDDAVGNYNIGGLVGYGKATITESYASGSVKGIEESPVYTGCLFGYATTTTSISTSYYDASVCQIEAAGVDNLGEKNPYITVSGTPAKSTAEMLTASTYSGWSGTIWKFIPEAYPFLAYFANSFVNAVVIADIGSYVYDGTSKEPSVASVTMLGSELVLNKDYTVAYANNVNAGGAMVKICGKGSYTGCKIVEFQIAPAEVTPVIEAIAAVTYNGLAQKPSIKVLDGENVIDPSLYTVAYSDNVNAGVAKVEVVLKKNYVGSASTNFTINKAKALIVEDPTASTVIYGKSLSSSEITGGAGNVEGSFAWADPDIIPTYENEGYSIVFIPTDTDNYIASDSKIIPITVIEKYNVIVVDGTDTLVNMVVDRNYVYTLPSAAIKAHYTFEGWFVDGVSLGAAGTKVVVNKDLVIETQYIAEEYEIRFVNGNVLLSSENVAYGEMPSYNEIPVKNSDDECAYKFSGWSPELAAVTDKQTYTALFSCEERSYEIVFVNGKDTLQNEMLAHGAVPFYKGAIPTKASTAEYSYEFAGWSPEIVAVDGAATYVATFKEVARTYVISTSSNDETMGLVYGGGNFKYGDEVRLLAFANAGYEFSNWEDDVSAAMNRVVTVAGNAEYKAVFKKIEDKLSSSFEGTSSSSDKLSSSSEGISSSSDEQLASSSSVIPSSSSVIPSEGEGSSSSAKSSSSVKNESSSSSVASSSSSAKSSSSSAKSSSSSDKSSSSSAKSSSSSNKSSSSFAKSSSSSGKSSSSSAKSSCSSSDKTGFEAVSIAGFSIETGHRSISIVGAAAGAKVHVMDMQGRLVASGVTSFGDYNLTLPHAGTYIVRVSNRTVRVSVK